MNLSTQISLHAQSGMIINKSLQELLLDYKIE